jgi:proline racemase
MFAAVLVEPGNPSADAGVVFMDAGGYLNMCIHGTIGLVTAGVALGFLPRRSPLHIESPAGMISAQWTDVQPAGLEVTVRNVPSFVEATALRIPFGDMELQASLVFAGSYFALVSAKQFGHAIVPTEIPFWRATGSALRAALNATCTVHHPDVPGADCIDLVEFYEEQAADRYTNITIFGAEQFDRSPCGTGTTAKLTLLHHQGRIAPGQVVESYSVLGSRFIGRVAGETAVHGRPAVECEVTGSAHITAFGSLVLQPNDPFAYGFLTT